MTDYLALAERANVAANEPVGSWRNPAEQLLDECAAALREAHAEITNLRNKIKASGRYKLREENERLRALLQDARDHPGDPYVAERIDAELKDKP
jgi:hypothetical protein